MIVDEVKKDYILDLVKKEKRTDERGFLDYREIKVEKNIIKNAEGSALASIGDTKVLAGVKFDLVEPFKDRPEEGTLIVGAEFSPIAHPEFEAGPPDENSIELARVVDRGIRSAEVFSLEKLFMGEGKAFGLFIDLSILDHSGNLIDAAALAAMGALCCTRVPKYDAEKQQIIRTEFERDLDIARKVVTCSFEKLGGRMVLDATDEEEIASEGRVTIATCDGDLVCAGQKSGRAGFKQEEMLGLVDVALEKGKELRKFV
jgi:exosome complex component RRP42